MVGLAIIGGKLRSVFENSFSLIFEKLHSLWRKTTMPLMPFIISQVSEYCERDLGKFYQDYVDTFYFVDDDGLRERLGKEFYTARYMAKLQEAMNYDEKSFQLSGYLKFQIVQYAGIYEAVISYLLKNKFSTDSRVEKLGNKVEYKKVDALSDGMNMQFNGDKVYTCKKCHVKTDWEYINFEEKLKVAKEIGFVTEDTYDVILATFKLRHSVHIEKAVKADILFEIEQARRAYVTIYTFLTDIRRCLVQAQGV